MNMQNLLVKVSYKLDEMNLHNICDTKISYIDNKDILGHLMVGGMVTKNSGTFTFQADDIEEAKTIAFSNPLIKHRLASYRDINYNFEIQG